MEENVLKKVIKIEKINDKFIRTTLECFYKGGRYWKILGSIVNSIYIQHNAFNFYIDHLKIQQLIRNDPNYPEKKYLTDHEEWKIFAHKLVTKKIWNVVNYQSLSPLSFDASFSYLPVLKYLNEKSQISPVFLAQMKAKEFGLLNRKEVKEENRTDYYQSLLKQERTKYGVLLEQIRAEELARLDSPDNLELTQMAVMKAIKLRKQKEYLEDIELNLLKSQS